MTISLKHAFTSAKADGADSTVVQPSDWNAEHNVTMAADRVLGRLTAGTGSVEELTAANLFSMLQSYFIPSGTIMLFQQTSAPSGWTKLVVHNDKALRLVSGTASSGGTNSFSTVMAQTTTGSHTLVEAEIPAHAHTVTDAGHNHGSGTLQAAASREGTAVNPTGGSGKNYASNQNCSISGSTSTDTTGITIDSTGGGGGHTHPISFSVQYVDVILAQKD